MLFFIIFVCTDILCIIAIEHSAYSDLKFLKILFAKVPQNLFYKLVGLLFYLHIYLVIGFIKFVEFYKIKSVRIKSCNHLIL